MHDLASSRACTSALGGAAPARSADGALGTRSGACGERGREARGVTYLLLLVLLVLTVARGLLLCVDLRAARLVVGGDRKNEDEHPVTCRAGHGQPRHGVHGQKREF